MYIYIYNSNLLPLVISTFASNVEVLRREVEGMALNVCHQLQDAGVKAATPVKFNMEPKNQPLGMEIPFGNHHVQVSCSTLGVHFCWSGRVLERKRGCVGTFRVHWKIIVMIDNSCFFSNVIVIHVHGAAKSAKVFHVFSAEWGP